MLAGTHLKTAQYHGGKIVFFHNSKKVEKSVLEWELLTGEYYELGKNN